MLKLVGDGVPSIEIFMTRYRVSTDQVRSVYRLIPCAMLCCADGPPRRTASD
jgi:hypothetical protein